LINANFSEMHWNIVLKTTEHDTFPFMLREPQHDWGAVAVTRWVSVRPERRGYRRSRRARGGVHPVRCVRTMGWVQRFETGLRRRGYRRTLHCL